MGPEKMDIELGLLSVDLENFRIGEHDTVREAYQAMLEEQKQNLTNLADDIIEHGLSPAELFSVCPNPDKPNHYIVCEGNRRITAIRMLETPPLAAGTSLHKRFVDLSKLYLKKPIKKVSCVVFKDKESAFLWIERKHRGSMGGRGVAQWGAEATSRADAFRGNVRPSKAVIDHLKAASLIPKTLETTLGRQTTNLDRVFQMPYMKEALGIRIERDGAIIFENGNSKQGSDLLVRMLKAMAVSGFTVDKIRHAPDRKDFIDQFSAYAVTESNASAGKERKGSPERATSVAAKKTSKKAPSPIDRQTLGLKGKEYAINIKEVRLNALYDEAMRLNPENLPNSAAILTRVFLELSTDYYLSKKKIPLPDFHVNKGRKKWSDIGIKLKDKINAVLKELDPSGNNSEFKEIRKGLSNADALHSVEALHDFVHHLESDPDPKEVKRIWARWHIYLASIFESIA